MREVISTPKAPSSPLYSQGIRAGDHLHISGLVGIDAKTGKLGVELPDILISIRMTAYVG